MRNRIEEAQLAHADLRNLIEAAKRLSVLIERVALATEAVREAKPVVGTDIISIALCEGDALMMRAGCGARTDQYLELRIPIGAGVGGKILQLGQPVRVSNYGRDPGITRDFVDVVVHGEGIGGISGVPMVYEGELLGVLCGAIRSTGYIGDRAQGLLSEFADLIAPRVAAARKVDRVSEKRVQDERHRIAFELHDTIGQLLFGIGVSAQKAQEQVPVGARHLLATLKTIECEASRAASCLRDALRALKPAAPDARLTSQVETYVRSFTDRNGVPVHFVVLGEPVALPEQIEHCVLAVVREGLHNVEKHARATAVVLTLYFSDDQCEAVIQDNGDGLPDDFELGALKASDASFGLTLLLRRLASCGGTVMTVRNEDGGTTLRATLPILT